jgi:TRAP-type mannitol/chloroaromatic compound transport system substrate-binding protein
MNISFPDETYRTLLTEANRRDMPMARLCSELLQTAAKSLIKRKQTTKQKTSEEMMDVTNTENKEIFDQSATRLKGIKNLMTPSGDVMRVTDTDLKWFNHFTPSRCRVRNVIRVSPPSRK